MDDQLAFYFEIDTTTLPEGKTPRSFCDQAIISEHIQTDFPQIWTFWGDGSLNYPKHDFFPLYVKNSALTHSEGISQQYAITFCNTAEFLEEDDAIPQRIEGDSDNIAIGWPDGQTLTSINEFSVNIFPPTPPPSGYSDPPDLNALQTWFKTSCHPPKKYGAPSAFLGAPQTVRIVVCNFDKLYRPEANIRFETLPGGPGHIGGAFAVSAGMTGNIENALCGLLTFGPFANAGMSVTTQSGPIVAAVTGISVEIDAGDEIFSEEFARDWTKRLLEFDEKWRLNTKRLANRFPDLNFQFVPVTPEGMADYVLSTSAALLPHNFQSYMLSEKYESVPNNAFSSSLAGKFLKASTPKPLLVPKDANDIPIKVAEVSPVGAIYGNVLNLIVVRASHASSVVPHWAIIPITSTSQGVVNWRLDEDSINLLGTDLDKEGVLYQLIKGKYFQNVGFKFLMDDSVLDVSDYRQYDASFQPGAQYDIWIRYDFDGTDVDEEGTLQESAWYIQSIRIGQAENSDTTYIFTGGTNVEGSGTFTAAGEAFLESVQNSQGPNSPSLVADSGSSFANGLRYPGTFVVQFSTSSILPGAYEDATTFGTPPGVNSGNSGNKSPSSSVIYGMVSGYSAFPSFGQKRFEVDSGNGKDLSSLTERALTLIAEKADSLFQASYEGKVSIDDPIEKLSGLIRKWYHVA